MAEDSQDGVPAANDVFSITPPPSDFDEFDRSGLLTCCSPPLPCFTYPSPAPSSRDQAPSVSSSDSLYNSMLPGISMSEPHSSHDLHQLSFEDPSSDSASFFPVPPIPDPSTMAHHYSNTTAPSASSATTVAAATAAVPSYNMFEQNQWYHYPNYSSSPMPSMPYDLTPYTNFDHQPSSQPSMANIIPPTPQDIKPLFDFGMSLPSNARLGASPSLTHTSHQSRSSFSSMSRSCSPISSLSRAHSTGGEMSSLRPQMRSPSTSETSLNATSLNAYGIPVTEAPPSMMPSTSLTPLNPSSGTSPGGSCSGGVAPGAGARAWRCGYPGCTSRATFTRGCDLRKHYNRHSKHLYCRIDSCPQSEAVAVARAKAADQPLTGGFSSKKDRARHEAKHNPGIKCEWRGPAGEECGRVFSRMDNMKDHVRRIHNKGQPPRHHLQQSQQQPRQQKSTSAKSSRPAIKSEDLDYTMGGSQNHRRSG